MSDKQKENNKSRGLTPLWIVLIGILVIVGIFSSPGPTPSSSPTKADNPPVNKTSVADDVKKALDKLGKDTRSTLASTSPGGYQGDIEEVLPDGSDGVKINVSTYFEDSGDGIDGGQGIARRIFGMVCFDVPELNSLYVISSSGLESKSVYRSEIPACK